MDARTFHQSLITIDGHCDSILDQVDQSWGETPKPARDLALLGSTGHIDVPRLLEGGTTGQFMALFTSDAIVNRANANTHMLLDELEKLCSRDPAIMLATRAGHLDSAKERGRIAAFVAIEGGEAIGESLPELDLFYARGVRLMTLVWSRVCPIGRGVRSPGTGGLTDFGRSVVRRMEHLGMIVDVSHCADETLDDVLAIASRPVVASHSNCRALCPHPRNLEDAQIERIAATNGLVAATFAGIFVDSDPAKVNLERFLDHVDRLISIAGCEHVGIGTDFDGFTEKYGVVLKDCTMMPLLTEGLLNRGHDPETVRAVMGGSWRRVISEIAGL